ncbi:Uncharacterised protein [Streptococcus pneumoniae]|nr:Uncharacterised protein [Streptococcus pneumoniae]
MFGQTAQHGLTNSLKDFWIFLLNIGPQLAFFCQMLRCFRSVEQGTGNHRRDFNMIQQIFSHFRMTHLLIDRLVLTPNQITIEIDRQIVHGLDLLKGRKDKEIIDIKSMFRQLELASTQQICPINQRVHHDILAFGEISDLVPAKNLPNRQD